MAKGREVPHLKGPTLFPPRLVFLLSSQNASSHLHICSLTASRRREDLSWGKLTSITAKTTDTYRLWKPKTKPLNHLSVVKPTGPHVLLRKQRFQIKFQKFINEQKATTYQTDG